MRKIKRSKDTFSSMAAAMIYLQIVGENEDIRRVRIKQLHPTEWIVRLVTEVRDDVNESHFIEPTPYTFNTPLFPPKDVI